MRLFIALCALIAISIPVHAESERWIIKSSALPVADTAALLETVIEASPAELIAKIDHAAAARQNGLEMGDSVLFVFGNPAIGTPLMREEPAIGLELPAKILVYDNGGHTLVGYVDPRQLALEYGIDPEHDSIAKLAGALDKFTDQATGK